ncbi:hypothetical protein [Clostridium oryzae]|uniref:Uncharacterized protein n=1 Tax=Clostridium oryzae TaxID=1450648 RepID=A0A1V4ID55_9CLOT|nr:hypothetical protein [Clostridium oryzae]OPJ57938.1 hypothetical protein CLORY_38470 [Clostridium oryzae]
MSKFLGPIHYWLYNKIEFQNELVERVINYSEDNDIVPELRHELQQRYGNLEHSPLEEIIDESNIHGWLQERVSVVEYRLAYAVNSILAKDSNLLAELEDVFFVFGKENAPEDREYPADVFKYLNDRLLDGMPCDRANEIVSSEEIEVTWKRNVCVHQSYWEQVGGDISVYYKLRDSLVNGMLFGSELYYVIVDENTRKIERR